MKALQADATGYPFATDPNYKAGQDFAGDIADGLSLRARKGPMLDYIGTAEEPVELDAAGSGEAVYGETIDVTDATWLHVEFTFYLDELGAEMNCAVGLEASCDGVYWYPLPVINRAAPIAPSTMFRAEDTETYPNPSTTGGYSGVDTTQNAPLLEDMLALSASNITPGATLAALQRAIPFYVASALYVRVVFVPIYTEPPDFGVPSVYVRLNKAVSP